MFISKFCFRCFQCLATGLGFQMFPRLQHKVSGMRDNCIHVIHSLTFHLLLLRHYAPTCQALARSLCSQQASLADVLSCKFVIFPQQLGAGNLCGFGFFVVVICLLVFILSCTKMLEHCFSRDFV